MVAVGSRDDVVVAVPTSVKDVEGVETREVAEARGGRREGTHGATARATLSTFASTRRVPTLVDARLRVRRRAREARSRTRLLPRRQRL
jgi:hypothetical protein